MFILNSNSPAPLYQQLYTQIREHILSGKLPADSRLPSVRHLATELSASRNTVEGAYQELYAEGYIYSKSRSGYFVAALDQETAPLSLAHHPSHASPQIARSHYSYDFHPAGLDPQSFPVAIWRKLYLESLRESSRQLVRYSDPQGELQLRCAIKAYLERSRGVLCEPDQIVVCAGLQQSLDIVAHLLKGSHTSVAVEDPGYHLPRAVFRNHSFNIVPVPVGPHGIDLDALRAGSGTVAYVTPSHQLPTGCVMPVTSRLKLIEWAEASDNMIIEDDYDSELRYLGKPIPSLQSLRPHGNIIYVGTFSKVLSPALRASYLVLPQSLQRAYKQTFADYFATVPLLEQRTLTSFMEQGHWERHIRRMRTIYKRKHDALLASVATHFGSRASVIGHGAGLHIVLQLNGVTPDETDIISRAMQAGIQLFPFSATCVTGSNSAIRLLLGFGGMSSTDIEKGIALLARLCFA
jgi:GntR family transcriptional regulator/MocR family aminotransferase